MATYQAVPFRVFDAKEENFEIFVQRFEAACEANETSDQKKVVILLSLLNSELLKLGNDLFYPEKIKEQSYEVIIKKIRQHLEPKPKVIPQRCKFLKRVQKESETVSEYLRELKHLATNCEFGSMLEMMLRDRFVAGLSSEALQKRLLQEEDDVKLDRVLAIAVSYELAEKDASELHGNCIGKVTAHSERRIRERHTPVQKYSPTAGVKRCYRCGERNSHLAPACPHKSKACYKCKKIGHLSKVCKAANYAQKNSYVHEQILSLKGETEAKVTLTLDGKVLKCVVDTGSPVTLMPKTIFKKFWKVKLFPTSKNLKTLCNNPIKLVGERDVFVEEAGRKLRLIVVDEGFPEVLLGREWLKFLDINYSGLLNVNVNKISEICMDSLIENYANLFNNDLGCLKDVKLNICIKRDAAPVFCKARSLPFAMKKKVEDELEDMVDKGILEPLDYADWAAPIVPVLKKDGRIRICGDFRSTANRAIILDKYPLPTIDEIFSKLSGSTVFSTLDLSMAYLQVELAEANEVVNINTTKGLFAYKRLPYGVAVAPNKFQRLMDNIFADIPGVACYIDDILVSGRDANEHKTKLELVFKRLEDKGLKLNKIKCRFAVDSVEYLGFRIDKNGLHPLVNKIQAVSNAPEPKNIGQLRSFIGMLMYYARFIKNISHILTPFYKLLKKNTRWKWTREHRILFRKCKSLLTNESVLTHYDPTKELVLACDASSYGLGVVLSHRDKNKQESPIAFASRTLTDAEKNYSQLEKEALSIVYGCEKFRQYLLGRSFVLVTDNRPLMHLFSPHKPIPVCGASRIKRWSLKLGAFHYSVEFRKTDDHGNADALSRLPLKAVERESIDEDQVLLLRKMNEVPFSFRDVAFETRRDKILSIVLRNVQEDNWQMPKISNENPLFPFYKIRNELSADFGCLQWRERIVIPPKLRSQILRDLHEMHFGIVRMKMIARRYFWWPGIDGNIEDMARECTICQESASMPPSTISEWTWPEKPWHRLHMDLAGPFMGKMFLIFILKEITSRTIIYHLRQVFARFGLPELLVTDNGRQFVSKEFEDFTKMNGIRHTKTSPYNPSTNGLAERYVREFKTSLRKNSGKDSLETNLERFLLAQRAFPQTVMKESPAELLMKRRLKTRFSNLMPKMEFKGEAFHDALKKQENFSLGSDVYFRNYAAGPKWKQGTILKLLSCRHYLVGYEDQSFKRHINQFRPVKEKPEAAVRKDPRLVLPSTFTETLENNPEMKPSQVGLEIPERKLPEMESAEKPKSTEPDLAPAEVNQSPVAKLDRQDRYPFRHKRRTETVKQEDSVELKEMTVKIEEATQVGNYFVQHLPRNPSMFSGEDGEDPLTWLRGYKRVAKHNHWDETLCLANVYFYLNGTALKWFENNEETIRNWEEFTTQLESVFGKSESLRLLAEKKLKIRGESTEFYMQDVLRLCKEVDLQMSEEDKISRLMKGIVEELYQALLPRDINNTDQFVSECRRIEALHRRRVTPAKYERLPNVASLDVQRALAAPREEPRIATIEDMVREEIDKTLAPISNPSRGSPQYRTYTPSPIARRETAAPQTPRPRARYPKQGERLDTNEWRTTEGRPICFHCGRPGHVARYCRDRWRQSDERENGYSQGRQEPMFFYGSRPKFPSVTSPFPPGKLEVATYFGGGAAKFGNPPSPTTVDMKGNYINIKIEGNITSALVDSGASYSVVSERFRLKLKKIMFAETDVSLRVANGKIIKPKGRCSLKLDLNGLQENFEFIVLEDCSHDVILGWDFLKLSRAEFLVEDTPKKNSPLYAEREYRIEPASCQLIELLSRDISDNATVVAESQKGLSLERELMAPSSIISLTSNRGKLWVANWSPYPKIIPQGMHVADGVVIEDSQLCVLAEGNHVGTDIGHSGDSKIAEILNIDDSLDDSQKEKLRNLLRNYRDIFEFRKKEASKTDNVKHRISTGNHLPTKQRPYRVAPAERQIIQEEVNKMEEIGIIQPSASPWASPVVLVRKKDGSWRFCVDYRRLNKITKKDVYPLPRIDDTLDCLQGARFYSSMDLQSGYWQIDVEESDREKTAFITPDGLYEFKKGLRWTICLCYLDDIVVFSNDFEEHLRRLQLVLGCLRKAGLCLNPGKCRFGAKTITVLGHKVSGDGIRLDPEKIRAVRDFPRPKSLKEIRSFLGLSSYYRRFIPNYAHIAQPLNALLKKDSVFSWNIEERHAFEALKSALIFEPVLGHFDHSSPTKYILMRATME
ncbi:K02A2.6-like [Cordylochernes scorpioides]|uniref:RNA-directed DNA polymerase n=1 Tax=Cordylochernes scorpioides TaxID=51811 RepID=A0ABY6LFT2_9ARAC|nr:K02A2.6-like [Cordylochernes scorpioides]